MKYIIGIDIGTSAIKAVAMTVSGEVLGEAQAHYSPLLNGEGRHELDPETLLESFLDTLARILQPLKDIHELGGISLSSAMHSLLLVDKMGGRLTNAITWADSRSKDMADLLKGTSQGNLIYAHTGTPIHAMSPLCKIAWFRKHQPGLFENAFKFIGIKEFIWHQLFGEYRIDYSLASATGLFDIEKREWFEEALHFAGIGGERLSIPVSPSYQKTLRREDLNRRIGCQEDIVFIMGGSDGCLANLGCSAVREGDAALTIGTSGALRMTASQPRKDPQQRIFNYILTEGLYVCGGAVNNGGFALRWFVDGFMEEAHAPANQLADTIEMAARVAPGSEGLIFLPYLLGERAPIWDENARGVFFGVNPSHGRLHFLRAVLEGISFGLYQVCRSLEETMGSIDRLYVSGGFIQSPTWLQMIADIFNKKIYVTSGADASALGAAMLGFLARGFIPDLKTTEGMVLVQKTYEPDTSSHKRYMDYFEIFDSLYQPLKDSFLQLNHVVKNS